MMVENRFNAISLWTLHPFTYMIRPKNFPEASPWTRRGVRGMAAPVPRDLPPGQGARARHLRRALEHLRERGIRQGPRRRQAELLPALLRAGRHLRGRQALPARERDPDARGVPGSRRLRRVARRGHGGHDAARAPAVDRRGADRGHAGRQAPREADPPRALLVGHVLRPRREPERRRGHPRGDREARGALLGARSGWR